MKKLGKRLISSVLIGVMILTLASIAPNIRFDAYAASVTKPPNVNTATVNERIKELTDALKGTYFTTDGKSCKVVSHRTVNDAHCNVLNVLAQNTKVRNLMNTHKGAKNVSKKDNLVHHYCGHNYMSCYGDSCFGFVSFAGWYIFASKYTDNVKTKKVVEKVAYNYNNMKKYAKPGDMIRLDAGHSAIVCSVKETGVKVLQSNWTGQKNSVSVDTIRYSSYTYASIARAENYSTKPCSHSWIKKGKYVGKCQNGCGTMYSDVDGFSGAPTNVKYTYKKAIGIRVYPANNSAIAKNNGNVSGGAAVKGQKGDWYKVAVKYDSDVRFGYVLKSEIKIENVESNLKVSTSGFTIKQGSKHTINGTVTSNYPITYVCGEIGSQSKSVTGKDLGKKFNIAGSAIDKGLKCGALGAGTHTLKITAKDSTGKKVSATATITVNGDVKAPEISKVEDATGGKKVSFRQNESGATLYYRVGSDSWKSTTEASFTLPAVITAEGTTRVEAYSKKGSNDSAHVSKDISVSIATEPELIESQDGKVMNVMLKAFNGSTIMYRIGSGSYSEYKGEVLSLNNGESISYYAKRSGYINSKVGEYTAEIDQPDTPEIKLANPESVISAGKTITVTWNQDNRATSYVAELYDSEDNEVEEKEVTDTTVSFTLPEAGKYYVQVTAKNEIGESESSNRVAATAKAPLTVTFRDAGTDEEQGAVLSEVRVEYGSMLSAIDAPSRKGHTFSGWENLNDGSVSQNSYLKTTVKEDTTYVATYEKNSYKVRLYDQDGALLKTKTVRHGEAVDTSEEESRLSIREGNIFSGWQVTETADSSSAADIEHVDSDMEVRAVVSWAEPELPVTIKIEEPKQVTEGLLGTNYITATVKLNNKNDTDLSMYLISALKSVDSKTGAEKTVYTDRKVVELSAGNGSDDPEKTIKLKLKPEEIANVTDLDIVAVERKSDMTTGSAYSGIASATVKVNSEWGRWSSWSPTKEEADGTNREEEVRYRYRDKEYTYNGNDNLSGYTRESTEYYNFSTSRWQSGAYTKYGNFVMSAPSKGTNTTASYKDVNSYTSVNAQWSYAYVSDKKDWYWTNKNGTSRSGQKTSNLLNVYSSKSLSASGYSRDTDKSYALPKTIGTSNPGKMGTIYRIDYGSTDRADTFTSGTANTWLWVNPTATRTLYKATTVRTRNKFWKWGNWSEWQASPENGTDTRQVEAEYRYRDKVESGKTDVEVTGTAYDFSGDLNVATDLAGKKATIMVFQSHNTDPNKYQMQYVGQTELGSGNHYEFSVIPKEEPTADTGNYIVALSVQGTTGLIKVGVIKAPQAEYDVELFYKDAAGKEHVIASGLKVKEHEDIDLSSIEIPELEGYVFMGWRNRTTDITSDCLTEVEGRQVCRIEAVYSAVQNAVVFVDWINQKIEIEYAATGTDVEVPAGTEGAEGYIFKGWKQEDGTLIEPGEDAAKPKTVTVTGNMIIEAEYEPVKYTVRFIGMNNEVVDTQTVNYGEAAEPPAYTAPAGKGAFAGWSTENNWWEVSGDVDVRAIELYTEQAAAPTSNVLVDDLTEARSLALETEEKDGTIFYTTDGTYPTDDQIKDYLNADPNKYSGSIRKYEKPITFEEAAEGEEEFTAMDVIAVTYADGKNTSEECYKYFEKEPEEDYIGESSSDWQEIGEYEVKATAGKDILINVDLEENPGLTGYDFLIESEGGTFYADADEYGEPVASGGELSKNGDLVTETVDGGWRINWTSLKTSSGTGKLFSMKLHTGDETESGTYPITVSYAPNNTYDGDFVPTGLDKVKVTIDSDASIKLDTLDVTLARTSYVYEGEAIEPAVKIEGLKEGTDYTVEYTDNINVGTAKAVITGMGDYAGTVEKEFTITQANIANADISEIADVVKTGEAIEPEIPISFNGKALVKDTDYEVTFADNVEVGTAKAVIKGTGNFKGTTEAQFNITETAESRLAEAEKKLAEAEKAKAEAEAKVAELQAAKEEAEQAEAEAKAAQAKAEAELQAAKEALEKAESDAEAERLAREAAEAEVTAAKAAQAAAEAEANTAKAAQEEAEARAEAAEAAKATAEAEAAQAKSEKEAAEKQVAVEKAAKEAAEAQAEAAKAAQATAEANEQAAVKAKEAAELQAANAESKLEQAEADLEAAKAAKAAAEADAESSAQAKAAAEQQLAEANEAKAAAEAELKEANEAKAEAESRLAAAEKEKEEAQKKAEEANKAKEAAEARAEAAEKELQEIKDKEGSEGGSGGNDQASGKTDGGAAPAAAPSASASAEAAEIVDLPAVKISKARAAKKAATVRWKKVSKKNRRKIAKIQIQYSMDKEFKNGVKTTTARKTAVSKKISKLASKKTYFVRIRAYRNIGGQIHVSKWSKVKKVRAK